ncbi:MAG TPA: hypothetical protein VGH38_03325, partial [Bryobacteraceae bacterium]
DTSAARMRSSLNHPRTLMVTVRLIVYRFGSTPGIGIIWMVVYVTTTRDAAAESGPVIEVAVTLSGLPEQAITPVPMLGSFRISPSARLHACVESAAVLLDVEV